MPHNKLRQRILESALDFAGQKRLPCEIGHELVRELGISAHDVADICQDENIRIVKCQLGCF